MSFSDLGLKSELLETLAELGFEKPTPIQEKAIPVLITGENDFLGLAQTGTGKTGAFGLPMLNSIEKKNRNPQGIVICPTRELCMQVAGDIVDFAKNLNGIRVTAVYGGANIYNQISRLNQGSQIVVATPGRLLDLIRRKAINLTKVNRVVLDEADEMLNMGFQEDIDAILDTISDQAKIWLFSATMPKGVEAISRNYLNDPVKVTIGNRNTGAENILHSCYVVQEKDRYEALRRILDSTPDIFGLVFCRTRRNTQEVAENLMRDGYRAEALHGDLSQTQRDYVMRKFRQKNIRVLVATDVAARGLDVDDITHVINYAMPDDELAYTHRSGRTARAGKSGNSIVLINPRERYRISTLENRCKIRFEFGKIPNKNDICQKQLFSFVEEIFMTEVNYEKIEHYMPQIYETFGAMEKENLIDIIISRKFGGLLEAYRHAPDIDASSTKQQYSHGQRRDSGKYQKTNGNYQKGGHNRVSRGPSKRFFISIGKMDKVREGAIVKLICDNAGIKSGLIGDIEMKREFSFFDIEKKAAAKVSAGMRKVKFDGRPVKVELSDVGR